MSQLEILLLITGIIFLFNKTNIDNLLLYVALVLIAALLVSQDSIIQYIGGSYISYVLLLVQLGGMSILFGMIMMLTPESKEKLRKKEIIQIVLVILIGIMVYVYYYKTNHSIGYNHIYSYEEYVLL